MKITLRGLFGFLLSTTLITDPAAAQNKPHGDTAWVVSSGVGKYGPPRSAREIRRIGGPSDTIVFGHINCVATLPDGGVAVLDNQNLQGSIDPVLYLITAEGKLRTLGRVGSGPGEFGRQNATQCLLVEPGGVLAMYDRNNNRINRWRLNGTFLGTIRLTTIPRPHGGPLFIPGPAGSYYIPVQLRVPDAKLLYDADAFGWLRIDSTGQVRDTVAPLRSWLSPPPKREFDPSATWFPLPDGGKLTTANDRLALLRAGPGVPRLLYAERPVELMKLSSREHAEIDETMNYIRGLPANAPRPPRRVIANAKPAWKYFQLMGDGTLWFRRYVASEPVAPHRSQEDDPKSPLVSFVDPEVFAGFRQDGTYLGEFRFPEATTYISLYGNTAWGVLFSGREQSLVQWRVGN